MRSKRAPYLPRNDPEKHWRAYLEIDIRPFFEPIFELRISLNCAPLARAMPLNSLLQSLLLILRPPRFGLAHSQGSPVTKRRTVPHRRSVPRAPLGLPLRVAAGRTRVVLPHARTPGYTSSPYPCPTHTHTHTHTTALRPAAAEEFEFRRALLRLRTTVVSSPARAHERRMRTKPTEVSRTTDDTETDAGESKTIRERLIQHDGECRMKIMRLRAEERPTTRRRWSSLLRPAASPRSISPVAQRVSLSLF